MARILLVDDDIAEISAVKRVLVRAGHQAVLATNASDALAVVAQATPALALVAAACEGGEALALAHRLASGDGAPPVPLILLGHAEGIPEGAAQLARPVDPGQLAQEVTAALARAIAAAPDPSRAAAQPPGAVRGNGTAAAAVRRTAAASSAPKPNASPAASEPPTAVHSERSVSAQAETRSRGTTPTATGFVEADAESRDAASAAERSRRTISSPAAPGGADVRRAAAEALRARADELRRTSPPATMPASADAEDDGFEALLRRAEEAERLHLAERKARARQADRATVEAAQRAEAERIAVEKSTRAREAEARAHVEERARADA
ncbi:MAG TPA: hypothetical protein VLC54_06530, partial [Anaeromyxobacter sp.]|nr:hypothetical protein [Anaeromyxobacter sp.]